MASPVEQFVVKTVVPLGSVGGIELGLTNAAVFMISAVVLIIGGLLWATRERALVPGRSQTVAEMLYEFVAGTLQDAASKEG